MKVKLLDGTEHEQDELIANSYSDSFYYGYLSKAALSSSAVKLLLDSPKTYYYVTKYGNNENSQALRDGHLVHTMILEPEKLNEYVFLSVASKNTVAYKEAAKYHTDVYTSKEKKDAERIVDAVFRNEQAMRCLSDSQFEIPSVGYIEGVPFRGKADILQNSGGICDIKTTVDVKNFHISASKYGYDRQCYIYCELFGVPPEAFSFLCIDKKNLDIGIFKCSQEFYDRGREGVLRAIDIYNDFFIGDTDHEAIDNYVIRGTL